MDTSRNDKEDSAHNLKAINKIIIMTNTNIRIHKILTVMKLLSTTLKKKKRVFKD